MTGDGGCSFDRVVVVDWSANSRPTTGRDSIWIAIGESDQDPGAERVTTSNPSTRSAACELLGEVCRRPGRTLVGVDFSLGYPAGTAHALGLGGPPWRAVWDELTRLVVDADDNANNRFEVAAALNARISSGPGPFWGCPPRHATKHLTTTKVSAHPLDEWRTVEHRLRSRGHRPFSGWQLLGAGSVGSQTLVGIPRLARLEASLVADGRTVEIWPFGDRQGGDRRVAVAPLEVGRRDNVPTAREDADVVVVEVWPSLHPLPDLDGRVRDEVQVITVARRLLSSVGSPTSLTGADPLSRVERAAIRAEEGWVHGA